MNYTLTNLTSDDLRILGEAIDQLPHGKVQKLVAKIQQQINEQEVSERDRIAAAQESALEAWRTSEREKLSANHSKSKKGR